MKDEKKTKAQLLEELGELRSRVSLLEAEALEKMDSGGSRARMFPGPVLSMMLSIPFP